MSGKLFVLATPIGNLGDISARALDTLRAVDFIASEDTRVSVKLLNHFEIKKPLVSYYEHNKGRSGPQIAQRIEDGESAALLTDAGTPAISDPGTELVALCIERGIEVLSIPGPCALIAALSISGFDCQRFTFEGFLSTSKKSRMEHLSELKGEKRTMVFYEAPHKLKKTLNDMLGAFGERRIALCREMTKIHEECVISTLANALKLYNEREPKGEFVLVIEGAAPENKSDSSLKDAVERAHALIAQGLSRTEAIKTASNELKVKKNALYRQMLEDEEYDK